MSHTDKTQPYHALFLEKGAAKEVHDHSLGECDLLPVEEWANLLKNSIGLVGNLPNCRWELKTSYLGEHPTCGCNLCTGSYERKLEKRRRRHSQKKDIEKFLDY